MQVLKALSCVSLVVLLSAKCSPGTKEPSEKGTVAVDSERSWERGDTLYYLDLTKPTVQQEIDSITARGGLYKFVQIEVVEVTNSKKHALTFDVRYRPTNGAETLLGSFSLYP